MAAPKALGAALPKDTVHYGCEIVGAALTPSGTDLSLWWEVREVQDWIKADRTRQN